MSGWRECTLGDILTLQRGFDITKATQVAGDIPVVSSSGINSFHDVAMVKAPGVVIGRKGTLGTAFFLDRDFWPHDTSLWVKDFKGNNPKFCYYLLRGMELAKFDVGSANPTLNRNHVHLLPVLCPPIDDQTRIALIVSAYDDLIEVNRRRIAVLEAMARGLFEEWFVRFRFPGHEYFENGGASDDPLPLGWSKGFAGDVIQFDPRTKVPATGDKPFVDMGRLGTSTSLIDEFEWRTGNSGAKFMNGDTLFARITPCLQNGKTGLVRHLPSEGGIGFGSTEFIVMRAGRAGRAFTYCLARHDGFRSHAEAGMAGASGRQRARTESVAAFAIAVPPHNDGGFEDFERKAWPMLELVGELGRANRCLAAARDLLLPRLISGKLSVGSASRELEAATSSLSAQSMHTLRSMRCRRSGWLVSPSANSMIP